tara:strand:- start:31 stop:195 length:165 start_codon:yes stop_codon:yes gene_type:complete
VFIIEDQAIIIPQLKVKFGKIKIRISKEYNLVDAKKAHEDLEARKLTGPAILIP